MWVWESPGCGTMSTWSESCCGVTAWPDRSWPSIRSWLEKGLADLPPADAVILLESHEGDAAATLTNIDPCVSNRAPWRVGAAVLEHACDAHGRGLCNHRVLDGRSCLGARSIRGVTVPLLILAMTAHYFVAPDEAIYEAAAHLRQVARVYRGRLAA
jgi:hypothetical protein